MMDSKSFEKLERLYNLTIEIGRFLRQIGQYEKSTECFEVLSEGDDTFETGDYAYEIGLNYELLSDDKNAHRYFQIAVNENPSMTPFRIKAKKYECQLPPDPSENH